jgi:hypothetical protein
MGDVAIVFGYMKLLDPESVVRESEYATVANSGSIPTHVRNWYNKAVEGTILTPEQRKDILSQSKRLFEERVRAFTGYEDEHKRIGGAIGMSEGDVPDLIGKYRLPKKGPGSGEVVGTTPGGWNVRRRSR